MAKKQLVKMTKAGEEPIEVSPLVVDNHKQLGWQVAGEESSPAAAQAPAEGGEESAKSKRRQRSRKKKAGESAPKEAGEEE